jgi:NTP pyrophosphatase (non-canonical NTP hydrolase)
MNLNDLKDRAYRNAVAHGWHEEEKSDDHWLCLVISELMESVEADRKKHHADVLSFNSVTEFTGEERIKAYETYIKGSVEEELADTCIRLLDFAGLKNVDLSELELPLKFNKEYAERRSRLTFTEWCLDCISSIVFYNRANAPAEYLIKALLAEMFCKTHNKFDLLWHMEEKMKYNETRPFMHDKIY